MPVCGSEDENLDAVQEPLSRSRFRTDLIPWAHGARRLGNLLAAVEWNIGGGASELGACV
jgi:hypothetical protein